MAYLFSSNQSDRVLSGSSVTLHGGATAPELRLHMDEDDGDYYSGFKSATLTENTIYAFPTAFPNSSKVLQSTDAGVLTWESVTATSLAADDIDAGNDNVDITTTSGNVTIDSDAGTIGIGTDDIDQAINIGTDGTRTITIGEAADSTVAIKSLGGTLSLNGTGQTVDLNSAALDVDASGAITIDGTSTVSIDGADDMNFTITSGTGGEDLTIAQLGANDSSIFITAAGTGADAIDIDATAGSMLIAKGLINGKTLTIGPSSATQMVFTPHGTAANEKISLTNTAGTADDAVAITSTAGGITFTAAQGSEFSFSGGTINAQEVGLEMAQYTLAQPGAGTTGFGGSGAWVTGSVTIGANDGYSLIPMSHGAAVTLPAAGASLAGRVYTFKDCNGSASGSAYTITPAGSDMIDGKDRAIELASAYAAVNLICLLSGSSYDWYAF